MATRTTQNSGKVQRRTAIGFIALMGLLVPALPASAAPAAAGPAVQTTIVLDGATSAEGIAAGKGTTFYAGDLALGDIYRGDIRTGEARLFIDAPEGRAAVGMKADTRNNLLFVAGGGTGKAYVYDTESGDPVDDFTLAPGFINDVTLTRDGAWFTNSAAAELYFLPVGSHGELGTVKTLPLSGPAAGLTGGFNLNGIAAANGDRVLIVAHSANSALYTVDPKTGDSAVIEGVDVPNVDGIFVKGGQLWAVQNFSNQVSRYVLDKDFASGTLEGIITSDDFSTPTTAALFGDTLAVVNAKFADPTATEFDVALVPARD